MKRIVAVILSIIFLLSLASCSDAAVNSTPTPTITAASSLAGPLNYDDETLYSFSYNLVRSGIDPEISFQKTIDEYRYNGTKLKDIILVSNFCGTEFTTIGSADNFSYRYWQGKNNETNTIETNMTFRTIVPVERFYLPCDISFEDDLRTALSKMDIPVDPLNGFTPDEDSANAMTLEKADTASLVFYDNTNEENGSYSVIFTENFEYNGLNYTKNLNLYYDVDGDLTQVCIRMNRL